MRAKGKIAAAAAVVAFVFGGAGVALAAAPSPSTHASPKATAPHPADSPQNGSPSGNSTDTFGSRVEAQVDACQAGRPTTGGNQGIGQCVSVWVVAHNPGHTNGHGAPGNKGH